MPTLHSYDYAYIRVVPRVERDEFFNAGVILFCRTKRFLDARIAFRPEIAKTMAPMIRLATLQLHLALIPRVCAGEGPIGALAMAERFHWLVAPHNTVIQSGPVHSGLCHDPAVALDHLLATIDTYVAEGK